MMEIHEVFCRSKVLRISNDT